MRVSNVAVGFGVNLLFGLAAFLAGSVDLSGVVAGVFLGTWIYSFLGMRGFLILAFFFVLASCFTRWGWGAKNARGIAQHKKGRRTEKEAFANCLVGAFLATFAFFTGNLLYSIAFVASFATALADTTATELGSLYGRKTFSIPSFKQVPSGTSGAVSVEGTLFGIFAAAGLTLFAFSLALIQKRDIPLVIAGSTVGFLTESLLAGTPLRGHDMRNFLNTFFGALATVVLEVFFYSIWRN